MLYGFDRGNLINENLHMAKVIVQFRLAGPAVNVVSCFSVCRVLVDKCIRRLNNLLTLFAPTAWIRTPLVLGVSHTTATIDCLKSGAVCLNTVKTAKQ